MDDHLSVEILSAEHQWDEQARSSGNDPLRAGCRASAEDNACIDRVQRVLARRAMARIRRLRGLRGAHVLDYGCGAGRWADFLRAYGCLYTGVDLSTGMLEVARRQHPDLEFRKTNGLTVPHGARTFDLVWSVAVVHHNPPDRQERLLAEFVRVLRDPGFLVLLEGVGPDNQPPGPLYYPRTRSAWLALAQRHGLSLRWRCGGAYFALRLVAELLGGQGAWLRLAARIDAVLCPRLVGCLPPPVQRRVVMVFQKRSAQELAQSWLLERELPIRAGARSAGEAGAEARGRRPFE